MTNTNSNPKRVETFTAQYGDCPFCASTVVEDGSGQFYCDECPDGRMAQGVTPKKIKTGWFYWFCFPGLPDSGPHGPFKTEDAAIADARDDLSPFRAGDDYLDAIHLDGDDDDYAYYAEETSRWYLVSRNEIVDLGRRLLAHTKDAYSFWCADHGAEVSDLDHDTLDRIAQASDSPVAYRCQCGEATGERCAWTGPRRETVLIEWMPEHLREDIRTAMNYGQYPHNGALRLRVERSCAERIIADDPEWAHIVEDAK